MIKTGAHVADSVGIYCLFSGVEFTAGRPLSRGCDIPNSQQGFRRDSMASTLTGFVHTDYCHGMNTYHIHILFIYNNDGE